MNNAVDTGSYVSVLYREPKLLKEVTVSDYSVYP